MASKKGQFNLVLLMLKNENPIQIVQYPFCQKSTLENWARGNRKTMKWLKMLTKCNFRTLKVKSYEEYPIYRTYFIK